MKSLVPTLVSVLVLADLNLARSEQEQYKLESRNGILENN